MCFLCAYSASFGPISSFNSPQSVAVCGRRGIPLLIGPSDSGLPCIQNTQQGSRALGEGCALLIPITSTRLGIIAYVQKMHNSNAMGLLATGRRFL